MEARGQFLGVVSLFPKWAPGIELRSTDLHGKCPSSLGHLAGRFDSEVQPVWCLWGFTIWAGQDVLSSH